MQTAHGLPSGMTARVLSWVGGPVTRRLAHWSSLLQEINSHENSLKDETNEQLKKRSLALRYRARCGERLERIVPEGYALVREASRRTIGQRHYDVQMIGGIALFNGCIAEMET